MSRRLDWDALRGFLLIMMTINHVPSPLDPYTGSPWGFITNAELFVFLSAFLAGVVFTKTRDSREPRDFWWKVLGRAGTVYLYHMVSVLVVLGMAWFFLGNLTPFRNNTWYFLENPGMGLLAAAGLVWQPAVLDILPLYIVMLLLTGPVLMAARRWGWVPVLGVSAFIWMLAWPIRVPAIEPYFHLKVRFLELLNLSHPLDFGMFNDFSWQFLWISALACGSIYYTRRDRPITLPGWLITGAGALALVGFVVKHPQFGVHVDLGDWWWLLGKWSLGPLRLLNLACLIILYMAISNRLRWLGNVKPLVRLGQNSIGVFTLHTMLVLPAVAVIEHYQLGSPWQIGTILAILAIMYGSTYLAAALSTVREKFSAVRDARLKPLNPAPAAESLPPGS